MTTLVTLKRYQIETATNVRHDVGDVTELAASIASVGLLNPLTVQPTDATKYKVPVYQLVAGHRRLAALDALEVTDDIAVIVRDPMTDDDRLAVQLVENLQREDLTPMEEARGLADLVAAAGSQKAAADLTGRSKGHVSKRLKLLVLDEIPGAADLVDSGDLPIDKALAAVALIDPTNPDEALATLERAATRYTTAADLEREAKRLATEKKHQAELADHVAVLEAAGRTVFTGHDETRKGRRRIDGERGLPVDYDVHLTEPCAAVVVVPASTWDHEGNRIVPDHPFDDLEVCTDPKRHTPDGDGSNLIAVDYYDELDATRAAARRLDDARRDAADAWLESIVAGIGKRDVLDPLVAYVLGSEYQYATDREVLVALKVAGVAVDRYDEPLTGRNLAEVLTGTDRYRVAIYGALRGAVTNTVNGWTAGAHPGVVTWIADHGLTETLDEITPASLEASDTAEGVAP